MISYNNSAPKAVNNVGQFGATEGSIGAYKSAAEYAADAKYWALLSQNRYSSVDDILAEVERLYAQGLLMESDIEQLKNDFEEQNQALLGLIQSTVTAIDNTNAATELSKEATQEVLAQLDIISNMTVQTTLLPPGSMATGSYDNTTGVFSFGIPEGQPGRDGTNGTISDIGDVAIGVPVSDDYGFYVDKDDGGLYRANMSDIANIVPSIRSISINGGEEQTGAVSFNSVSSFNNRTGDVVAQTGDYEVGQITGAAKSGANSDITSLSGLTTALSVSQGGTGASTPEASRTNLGLGSVSVEDIVPLIKGGTGATTPSAARTNLGLGLVSTESIVPISKGGTGSTSAENARLALVAAKSGANSDITSMTNSVTFTQPISVADAVEVTNAVNLGQISSDQGASLIGTLEGVPVQDSISSVNTDVVQLKLNWAIENGYSDAGFTFTTGGTLAVTDRDKVVYDPASKTWYSYSGTLPITLPAGSSPVGSDDWKPQTDPNLRAELSSNAGSSLVGSPHSGSLAQMLPWVTPEQFGAVGDGVTDDIEALDACMSYARERAVDIVFSKNYAISRPYVIYMGNRKNPRHIGMGSMAKITLTSTATSGLGLDSFDTNLDVNAAVIVSSITGTGYNQQPQNFRWENIDIDTTVNADYGMYTSKMQSASVRNFRTYNFKTGIQDNGSWNTLYENIKMNGHSVVGFRKTAGTSTTIRNCYIEQSTVGYRVYSGYSQIEGCACDTSTDVGYWIEGNTVASSSDNTFSLVSCGSENSGSAVVRLTGTVTLSVRNFQAFNYASQQDPIPEYFLDLQSNNASISLEDIRYIGISSGRVKDTGTNNTVIIRNMTTRGTDVRSGDVFPNSTRIIELGRSGVRVASGYNKNGIELTEDRMYYNSPTGVRNDSYSELFNKQRIWRTRVTLTRTSGTYARIQVTLPFDMKDTSYNVQLTPAIYHTDIATHALVASVGNTDKTNNSFYVNVGSINGSSTWTSVFVDVLVYGVGA